MDYTENILNLFSAVFEKHKNYFKVKESDIKEGIGTLREAYVPNPRWEFEFKNKATDFSRAGVRCAYIFKYAMLHTGLVCDILQQAFRIHSIKQSICSKQFLNLCSLGSGPGSDIVALIFVLNQNFGFKKCRVDLIDYSAEWKYVFDSVVSELKSRHFKSMNQIVSSQNFSYAYFRADLLNFTDGKVVNAVRDADIITMVKFLSAAACKDTRNMIEKIFNLMKPGAILLFVDNAGGGFYETVAEAAEAYDLKSVFGPYMHQDYEEKRFNIQLYGTTSQYKAKVTYEIWRKSKGRNTTSQLRDEYFSKGLPPREGKLKGGSEQVNINISGEIVHDPTGGSCCTIM